MKLIKFKRENFIYPEYGIVENNSVRPIKNHYKVFEIFNSIRKGDMETESPINLEDIRPLPPTDEYSPIYCAGLNYHDHARELNMAAPAEPVFFCKPTGALNGALDDILYPPQTSLLDYEVELAVIIGNHINSSDTVTRDNLPDYILGLTIMNDVSARDLQLRSGQWFMGKCFKTFAPLGPIVQTMDEDVLKRLDSLHLKLNVYTKDMVLYENKAQRGSTGDMIFSIEKLINALKEKFPLNPGDVIATGTPRGVALSKPGRFKQRAAEILGLSKTKALDTFLAGEVNNNKRYLQAGDLVIARIFSDDNVVNLGELKNKIVKKG